LENHLWDCDEQILKKTLKVSRHCIGFATENQAEFKAKSNEYQNIIFTDLSRMYQKLKSSMVHKLSISLQAVKKGMPTPTNVRFTLQSCHAHAYPAGARQR
jgi:hypothetical protein